jgi:pimeloyl-ACP methyl ester carboxylesterase
MATGGGQARGAEVRHVEAGGLRIGYRRAGAGPALLLLHGAYEDSRIWSRQLVGLADELTVVAWDAPGCGASDDPPDSFTTADYSRCAVELLAALGFTSAHVLGLSWGSMLALDVATRHPAAVDSLVLASAYAGWAGSLPPDEVQRRVAQVLREVEQPAASFIPDWMPGLLTERAPRGAADEVAAIMADFHPVGMRHAALTMGAADLRPVLPTIAVPTLLLYGELDARSPVAVGRALHEQIPGSELVVLPGAPHLAMVEQPEAFDAAVRAFVRSASAT